MPAAVRPKRNRKGDLLRTGAEWAEEQIAGIDEAAANHHRFGAQQIDKTPDRQTHGGGRSLIDSPRDCIASVGRSLHIFRGQPGLIYLCESGLLTLHDGLLRQICDRRSRSEPLETPRVAFAARPPAPRDDHVSHFAPRTRESHLQPAVENEGSANPG